MPQPLTGEVAAGQWFVVHAAVEAFSTGDLPMWPPTISTLASLTAFDDVATALAAAPSHIEAVTGMIEPVRGTEPQRARCVTAANPGVLTLSGTNTWVLFEPDAERCVVVDPGPDDPAHVDAVLAEVERAGCEVDLILVTHRHPTTPEPST